MTDGKLELVDKFHIRKKGFTFISTGFYVYDDDDKPLLYVDIPDFKLVKQVHFYVDESKTARLFWVKQDKVLFATTAEYTLYIEGGQAIAKYRAELLENILLRNVKILTPGGDQMCSLVEKPKMGRLLAELGGAEFSFVDGEEILGLFHSTTPKGNKYALMDLKLELDRKLDVRIALGAVLILYGRLI